MSQIDPSRITRWIVLLVVALVAVGLTAAGHGDWANIFLALAVLLIAADTLNATLPKPAQLHIEREGRESSPDLIFYLVPTPPNGAAQWPRDFLLNLDVLVVNIGGRKTVLSLDLVGFQDSAGQPIEPLTLALPLSATLIRQRRGFVATGGVGRLHFETMQDPGPFVIEPDDSVTLRLRWRGGIDWTQPLWPLDRIRQLHASLDKSIVRAVLRATFRRGRVKVDRTEVVLVSVEQQALYRAQLGALTQNFTSIPAPIPPGLQVTVGSFE